MDEDQGGPTLVSTGSRGGWKLPALVVLVLLVGLVAITRLGGSPATAPAPTKELALEPTQAPTAHPTAQPSRLHSAGDHLTGVMPLSADGLSYADGIPTAIGGAPVFRVGDAVLLPFGRQLLVGGWYLSRACRSDGSLGSHCPAATLSDVPLDTGQRDVTTNFVALDERLVGSGAHIVLATVERDPRCSIHAGISCQPRLRVLEQIWSGAG